MYLCRTLTAKLALGWRIRMTNHLLRYYLKRNAFYKVYPQAKKTQTHYCFIFLFWLTCHTLLLLYILVMVPKDSVGGVAAVLIFILIRHLFIYSLY